MVKKNNQPMQKTINKSSRKWHCSRKYSLCGGIGEPPACLSLKKNKTFNRGNQGIVCVEEMFFKLQSNHGSGPVVKKKVWFQKICRHVSANDSKWKILTHASGVVVFVSPETLLLVHQEEQFLLYML